MAGKCVILEKLISHGKTCGKRLKVSFFMQKPMQKQFCIVRKIFHFVESDMNEKETNIQAQFTRYLRIVSFVFSLSKKKRKLVT